MRFLPAFFSVALALCSHAGAQDGSKPLTRIAFGSCADEEKPQPIWNAVLGYEPELFIFAGDNVYGDIRHGRPVSDAELIASLREAYGKVAEISGFKVVKQTIPHLATWDDHDYGKNDAGEEFVGKREAQALFLEFWGVPVDDQRRKQEGVYHARTFGGPGMQVQVILLDTRYFRSPLRPTDQRNAPGKERYLPDDDPTKTMLGETQWAWLAERLGEPADLRLIVSSIQVLAEGHGWERWGNLPHERKKLFELIRTTNANGVVFLSGDRHVGAFYRETNNTPYALLEITSSGLNQTFPGNREDGPNRLGSVYGAANFGSVEIDWSGRTVTLSLRGLNGEPVQRETVLLDRLKP